MSDQDPKRLFDELRGGELKDLLAAGKSETPNDHQMLALAAKMGIAGGLGGLGGAGAAGGLGGGGGAAGGAASGGAAGAGAGAKGAVVAGAVKGGLAIKIVGAVAVVGAVGAGTVVVTKKSTHADHEAPAGLVASAPVMTTVATHTASVDLPPRPDPFASVSAPTPTAKASAPAKAEDEVKMLERAQDALKNRPDEALAICNEHARAYPSGMLAQEREVIAIEALVKSGRRDEARARAEKFKARWPGSSHTRRIETLLAQ